MFLWWVEFWERHLTPDLHFGMAFVSLCGLIYRTPGRLWAMIDIVGVSPRLAPEPAVSPPPTAPSFVLANRTVALFRNQKHGTWCIWASGLSLLAQRWVLIVLPVVVLVPWTVIDLGMDLGSHSDHWEKSAWWGFWKGFPLKGMTQVWGHLLFRFLDVIWVPTSLDIGTKAGAIQWLCREIG